jgi:hypothetical protein
MSACASIFSVIIFMSMYANRIEYIRCNMIFSAANAPKRITQLAKQSCIKMKLTTIHKHFDKSKLHEMILRILHILMCTNIAIHARRGSKTWMTEIFMHFFDFLYTLTLYLTSKTKTTQFLTRIKQIISSLCCVLLPPRASSFR